MALSMRAMWLPASDASGDASAGSLAEGVDKALVGDAVGRRALALAILGGKRRFGFAGCGFALRAQFLQEGVAVLVEMDIARCLDAGGLGRLGDGGVELALRRQAERDPVLWRDVGDVQLLRSRIAAIVVRVVPISSEIAPSVISG